MPHENQDKLNQPIAGLGAVVLCGGKSTRLGIDKSRLDFKGRTFLEQVVAQVGEVCERIVVVGNTDLSFHRLPENVWLARDQAQDKGPLEGIRVGLERLATGVDHQGNALSSDGPARCDLAFVTSCDVPLLKPELIRFLYNQLGEHQAVVPVQGDRVFGMTAIYRTEYHVEIGNRVKANDLRVSDLAAAFSARCIEADALRTADPDLDSMTNVNSVSDYRQLLERLGLECPPELAKAIGLDSDNTGSA